MDKKAPKKSNNRQVVDSYINMEEGSVALGMIQVSDDDALLLKHVIDSNGKVKLYAPIVQRVLLATLKAGLLAECKKEEVKETDEKKDAHARSVRVAAELAREIASDEDEEA